jgi:hypothetical protein
MSAAAAPKPVPIFVVPTPSARSVEENVKLLGDLAHVVEVKAPFALVHASPGAVAKIATDLALEVFHSKTKGPDYFAVRVQARGQVPVAPASETRVTPFKPGSALDYDRGVMDALRARIEGPLSGLAGLPGKLTIVPNVPKPAPQVRIDPETLRPVELQPGVMTMEIRGQDYVVRETPCKRRQDMRRWEVRKLGDSLDEPYVVTFQNVTGTSAECGCKDWIYRRHLCKHIRAIQAAFGGNRARFVAASAG